MESTATGNMVAAAFDVGMAGLPPGAAAVFGSIAMNGDEYVRCIRCGFGGCDVRVVGCGCTLHARCTPVTADAPMSHCPQCNRPTTGLILFPMSFREIDEARRMAAALSNSGRKGRKRKSASITKTASVSDTASVKSTSSNNSDGGKTTASTTTAATSSGGGGDDDVNGEGSDRRTGRWTTEEMAYCDKLMVKFRDGQLPVVEGIKLNDFLANMLKSKQSRLTKKMKNAKLSSKTFNRTSGFILDAAEAREFSDLEDSFYHSIQNQLERAEIKFHMQKEWRELFSSLCVSLRQPLDADAWLSSVEEMDRRASLAKDAARMARRKLMMGYALSKDSKNPDQGVFIEKTEAEKKLAMLSTRGDGAGMERKPDEAAMSFEAEELLNAVSDKSLLQGGQESLASLHSSEVNGKSSLLHAAPFLSKVTSYMHRHGVPFEHVDAWVPSFVPTGGQEGGAPGGAEGEPKCRLCYAGCATTEMQIGADGKGPAQPLSQEERFNLLAFGDYSQKFSFDVGCGLPGRVYQSGVPTWEQSVQNAPHHHFERCGGAMQWGIKTVVGIPVPSPNVGRIVVTLYSRHDRPKDSELVSRLSDEFARLMPSPKWKLVVDVSYPPVKPASEAPPASNSAQEISSSTAAPPDSKENRVHDLVALLGEHMPSDPSSPHAVYLQGFMSLRLMLLRPSRTEQEEELVRTMLGSYTSYSSAGRTRSDIAVMLARDFMFLTQPQPQQQMQQPLHASHPQQIHLPQQQQPQPQHVIGRAPAINIAPQDPNMQYYAAPGQENGLMPILPSSGGVHDTVSIVSN